MVLIATNLATLIARLEKARKVWPRRVLVSLRAELDFLATARAALQGVMIGAEVKWLPGFIAGIRAAVIPDGLAVELTPPPGLLAAGMAAGDELARSTGPGRPRKEAPEVDLSAMVDAEEAVRAWVEAPVEGGKFAPERPARGTMPIDSGKVLTPEDEFDPEVAIDRVMRILGFRGLSPAAAASEKRADAASHLAHRIEGFIAATGGSDTAPISAARMRELLRAVLLAWVAMVRAEVPRIFERELRELLPPPGQMKLL